MSVKILYIFRVFSFLTHILENICQNIVLSKYFHKMIPLLHKFCLFCNNLCGKFSSFLYGIFSQTIFVKFFAKMRKRQFFNSNYIPYGNPPELSLRAHKLTDGANKKQSNIRISQFNSYLSQ